MTFPFATRSFILFGTRENFQRDPTSGGVFSERIVNKREKGTHQTSSAFVHSAAPPGRQDVRKSLFRSHVPQSRYISHLTNPSCLRPDVSGMNSRTLSNSRSPKGLALWQNAERSLGLSCTALRIVTDISFVNIFNVQTAGGYF